MKKKPSIPAVDRLATPWLIAATGATIAPHALHQPYWLTAIAALLLGWAAAQWFRQGSLPGKWWLLLLLAASCAGILVEFRTLLGRDAGVALLVLLIAMKLLELRNQRDAFVVIMLGYFLLLTHYFYSQSLLTGGWLLLSFWLLTATLVVINGGSADPRQALRQAGQLCLQAVPFMLVLYLLFPRVSGPLWGLPQDAHSGKTGLSETMSPGSIANLARSGEIAFRVRFDAAVPPRQMLYWRGPVMESFDGTTWRQAAQGGKPPSVEARSPAIRYETTLEAHNQRWLLALDAPQAIAPEMGLESTLTVTTQRPVDNRMRFRLSAALDYRLNVAEAPDILRRNLSLPPGHNPRTRELAETWRAQGDTPGQRVARALNMFTSENFVYTLQPPLLGRHGTDDFLFHTRRGFCEHYAAAFVILMRAAGVPARVVGGYQGGEVNPVDGFLVVRQSDAHAWAEVWLEGQGWVRVDPTAAVAPSRIERGIANALPFGEALPGLIHLPAGWWQDLRHRWEALNNAWNQHVLGYDARRQRDLLARLGLPDADWRSLAIMLGIACSLLLAIITLWSLARRPVDDPAQRLWLKAMRQLRRHRVDCPPWETPSALQHRLRRTHPALAEALAPVVRQYLLARYATDPDGQQLKALREAVSRLP